MIQTNAKNSDIPWPVAVVLLAATLLILTAGGNLDALEAWSEQLEVLADRHPIAIALSLGALLLNGFSLQAFFTRYLSLKRQGSRLRELTGRTTGNRYRVWRTALVVSCFAAIYAVAFVGLSQWCAVPYQGETAFQFMLLNFALAAAIVTIWTLATLRGVRSRSTGAKSLPREGARPNSIFLGTSPNDETADGGESWISLSKRALNGNIFITGSIGSGKTQGTILPYFDQILATFTPTPSVVAIDPKGTFIKDAEAIAAKHGLKASLHHLRLRGSVSFNPIYVDEVLRHGRFLDIAQMIRAASINFAGRGTGDSPFWELSAFNLTKNALIFVAAVHGYFTLNDLYSAMIAAAAGDEIGAKLERALREGDFDPEEETNIRHAMSYFAGEFANFDHKVKTGILATATAFLNQFQEFQASRIFCPAKDERTFASMDEVVDEGKILLFDIDNPGLARAMGTFIKLHYQQSVLKRLTSDSRPKDRSALLVVDEYQDVVSSGYGTLSGDDRFLAKGREANAITIVATQSLSSVENSLGRGSAARELCQNFRTRIACHSTDLLTIKTFQDLVGEEDREKSSHSISELSQDARRNIFAGGFDAENANISESITKSSHREAIVTGKDFSRLGAFEAFGLIYDGVQSQFTRLCLKPYFLEHRETSHANLKKILAGTVAALAFCLYPSPSGAFPNVCDVVKQAAFSGCMEYRVSSCTCPGIPPRPCARFSYYVPETFIEVVSDVGSTKFRGLPGVNLQLANLGAQRLPFGTESFDFAAFQARTLPTPFASMAFNSLPCRSGLIDATCFGAMSEHLGSQWTTGAADMRQPNHLLWAANPKACILAGSATAITGGGELVGGGGSAMCSVPLPLLREYPPSLHSACNGWGIFYPRVGIYDGPSQTTAALMIGGRMKSLSTEVFQSAPASPSEKWQMILPSGSMCFREGQTTGMTEIPLLVNDRDRIRGRFKDYLFVVWRRVSCCRDLAEIPVASAALAAMTAACQGMGGTGL